MFQKLLKSPLVQDYRKQLLARQKAEIWKKYRSLNKTVKANSILFSGDSITEFFPIYECFETNQPLYNRGVRGIGSLELLEHIEDQILDVNPEKLFLLIGVNDLKTRSVGDSFSTIQDIIKCVQQKLPKTEIYLQSIYPINMSEEYGREDSLRNNCTIQELNSLLSQIEGVTFISIFDKLLGDDGQLRQSLTVDGVHLSVDGYRIVAEEIQGYI